jgi:amidase
VVTLDADRARQEAAHADARLAKGEGVGPLHGLPVTVKDCLETADMRTTCGARELAGYVPDRDAEAVARLRRAGAIIAGKTNLPAWAAEVATSVASPVFPFEDEPPPATPGQGPVRSVSRILVVAGA